MSFLKTLKAVAKLIKPGPFNRVEDTVEAFKDAGIIPNEKPQAETPPAQTPPTVDNPIDTNQDNVYQIGNWESAIDQIQKNYDEQIARQDKLIQESYTRADNAYQRAVSDMRKAGINPNLVNISPAEIGGTAETVIKKDYGLVEQEFEKYANEIEIMLEQEFKANENQKDRMATLISGLMKLIAP